MIEGNGEWFAFPDEESGVTPQGSSPPERLDALLPADGETGAVTHAALKTYLGALIDLVSRHGQPLALLAVAPDPSDTLSRLGPVGAELIGSAIAQCMRQVTRVHDVVARSDQLASCGVPHFFVVLPLMNEALATPFGERMRVAMTTATAGDGRPWLTISVGVASLSLDSCSPDTLILRAREALSSAQRAGGGRVWGHADTVRRIIDSDRSDPRQE